MLCDACGLNEFIEYDEESFNNINWDEEVDNIIDVFVAVLDLADIGNLDENYLESDNFEETSEQLANLFDALVKCSITKPFALQEGFEKKIKRERPCVVAPFLGMLFTPP